MGSIPSESPASSFLTMVAFIGFLTASVLFINLNRRTFDNVFGAKALKYRWLTVLFLAAPIFFVILLFSILFDSPKKAKQASAAYPRYHAAEYDKPAPIDILLSPLRK